MKLYQHHDTSTADKGKAVPHPRQPTQYTMRRRGFNVSIERESFLIERALKNIKGKYNSVRRTVVNLIRKAFAKH